MISCCFQTTDRAAWLPDEWNELAEYYFQQREFLHHTEVYNPCRQRYYLLWKNHELLAGACVYTLSIHLFTFSRIPSRMTMTVIGLPVSVSASGLIGRSRKDFETLIGHIAKTERGLVVALNLQPGLQLNSLVEITMMPTIVMERQFASWEYYIRALRSSYRRRALHIIKAFEQVKEISTDCTAFTSSHHDLYLQIMKHTKDKLETLSLDFFKNLPGCFELTSYYHNDKLLCWNITCRDSDQIIFFFGGHDYRLLNKYQSYFNNLFGITRKFIEGGYKKLDMGQTAEIAKMKTGGKIIAKASFLYHRNIFVRFFLRLFKPLISYQPPKTIVHPFRKMQTVHHVKTASDENIIRKAAPIA